MFTGIVEELGAIESIVKNGSNLDIVIKCPFTSELQIDQSVSHNGVCLTVTKIEGESYQVTAVDETLTKTNLNKISVGDKVNLERCMKLGARLDGHIVQGHVDTVGSCVSVEDVDGSWNYKFSYPQEYAGLVIDKGSICINGTSLTVINPDNEHFSVTIIPYTYEHTNFHILKVGDLVNLEFDILGKYILRNLKLNSA